MDYLQAAKDAIEQSQGDIRWEGQKEHLVTLATVYAAIAQAESARQQAQSMARIVSEVEQIGVALSNIFESPVFG